MLYKIRSPKIVRSNRSPWFGRSAYLANRSPNSFGQVVRSGSNRSGRSVGLSYRVEAVRGRLVGSVGSVGAILRPSPCHPLPRPGVVCPSF